MIKWANACEKSLTYGRRSVNCYLLSLIVTIVTNIYVVDYNSWARISSWVSYFDFCILTQLTTFPDKTGSQIPKTQRKWEENMYNESYVV